MRLLLRLLRPETVPSPRRKKIPFGTRVQLSLYRSSLKGMCKWYSRYAFSDTIVIGGTPQIKLVHEFRDMAFEAELKRLRLLCPENMLDRGGETSSLPFKWGRRPYFGFFKFKDTCHLEVGTQKIALEHGDGRSFASTIKGRLKESDAGSLLGKYVFSGTAKDDYRRAARKSGDIASSIAGRAPDSANPAEKPTDKPIPPGSNSAPKKKDGSLFGDDPLLGKDGRSPVTPVKDPVPTTKSVAGVDIDESF